MTEEELEKTAEAYADSRAHEESDHVWELVKQAYIMGSKDREKCYYFGKGLEARPDDTETIAPSGHDAG